MSSYLECLSECIAKFEDSLEFTESKIANRLDQINGLGNAPGSSELIRSEKVFFDRMKKRTIEDTVPIILEDLDCIFEDVLEGLEYKDNAYIGNPS